MVEVTEKRNANALPQLLRLLGNAAEAAAWEGAYALDRNLAAGARSGKHYRGARRRSSAPGEYSQEQEGTLRRMVGARRVDDTLSVFGLFPRGPKEVVEAKVQEDGAPRRNVRGRGNVRRTALDANTRRKMAQAAVEVFR